MNPIALSRRARTAILAVGSWLAGTLIVLPFARDPKFTLMMSAVGVVVGVPLALCLARFFGPDRPAAKSSSREA
ncbi:MAG: hypothetical protein U0836_13615 [Pirellulales bacterium]